jgi:hypothetical protein
LSGAKIGFISMLQNIFEGNSRYRQKNLTIYPFEPFRNKALQ